jgi:hypothetical protein
MFQPKRYYSSDYGWRQREHAHVAQLTHLKADIHMFECECGESYVGHENVVGAMMMAHRMEVFPLVRAQLGGETMTL